MEADTQTKISNYYIHKFTAWGTEITRWGPIPPRDISGEFMIPFSLIGLQGPIALDPTGNVYVAVTGETPTGKVLVFDGVGTSGDAMEYRRPGWCSVPALWDLPLIQTAMYTYRNADVRINTHQRILKFDQNGVPISRWEVGSIADSLNIVTVLAIRKGKSMQTRYRFPWKTKESSPTW